MTFAKLTKFFLYPYLLIFLLSSCIVSKKKYDDNLAEKVKLEGEKESLAEELKTSKSENDRLNTLNKKLLDNIVDNEKQIKELKENQRKLEGEKNALNKTYENLLSNSGKLSSDLAKQQSELLKTEQSMELVKVENEKLLHDLKEREEKVKTLEKLIADKEKAVNDLKNKISQALLNFKENDLTVDVRNGKVYVSLAEQLLFKSGSISVDPKGIQALKQLGGALKNTNDINVLVEGHTDDVPISKTSQYMNDNWDLSVMRATAISKILINNGVDPQKITAAGRGEYFPLEKGKTSEARQKNRRTEIILTPKLDELFQILEAN